MPALIVFAAYAQRELAELRPRQEDRAAPQGAGAVAPPLARYGLAQLRTASSTPMSIRRAGGVVIEFDGADRPIVIDRAPSGGR